MTDDKRIPVNVVIYGSFAYNPLIEQVIAASRRYYLIWGTPIEISGFYPVGSESFFCYPAQRCRSTL